MDNLAHTLIGAALGRTVAGRDVPAAGWIGAVAGNAPDIAELLLRPSSWWGHDGATYLVFHRGITHSLAGAAAEIAVLTGLIGLIARWWGRSPPWRWIAACVAVTVASHLYLDWQGSYGLRPFLPWSGGWYYGDWVAIVDPFFWIVPLVALAWGERRHWRPALVYLLALVAVTGLVVWAGRGSGPVVWVQVVTLLAAGVGLVGWERHWFGVARSRRAAAYGLLILTLYVGASAAVATVVKRHARATAVQRFGPDARWAALTVVGRPFQWQVIVASSDSVAGADWAFARRLDDPAVRAALDTRSGRAIAQFARFLVAAVESRGGDRQVTLWDARYHRTPPLQNGFAAVVVPVPSTR